MHSVGEDIRAWALFTLKAMPHGREKSPAKNRNEIRHSLCRPMPPAVINRGEL